MPFSWDIKLPVPARLFSIVMSVCLMYSGLMTIVDAFSPSSPEKNPDFYRISFSINNHEQWAEMMRPATAQLVNLLIGVSLLLGGTLWLLYLLPAWPFQPEIDY
jgi:hypothetical protein